MFVAVSKNPFDQKIIQEYPGHSVSQVETYLSRAAKAFIDYRRSSFTDRSTWLLRASELLRTHKERYARTISMEMGKIFKESMAEVEKCAWVCKYYAEHGEQFLKDRHIKTEAKKSYVHHAPLGTVLSIMPWNFPFWQVFRNLAPILMGGNTLLLKHASNVTGSALHIKEIIQEAGFPEDIFNLLIIDHDQIPEVIADQRIQAVSLTGSTKAGKIVGGLCGRYIKKCVLELGGSDPYIIFPDADLDRALDQCVKGRLLNAGQSCIGAKRFIIFHEIYDRFKSAFVNRMASAQYGDPFEAVDFGPMAKHSLRDALHEQVAKSVEQGAQVIIGAKIPKEHGAFYPATILEHVQKGMPAYHEELFGPVACLFKVQTESEAIRIANDTSFGLGASVFSNDLEKVEKLVRTELDTGCCFINHQVMSHPHLPFGGIKSSGYGRELSSDGLLEFINKKTIYLS